MGKLHAATVHGVDVDPLGLNPGTRLLSSLKQRVVELASNAGVIATVQAAAQAVLQTGWSILLPTADERARALSTLLPSNCAQGDSFIMSPGRRFMSDLLVGSLMADGGLETALRAAVKAEIQEMDEMKVSCSVFIFTVGSSALLKKNVFRKRKLIKKAIKMMVRAATFVD